MFAGISFLAVADEQALTIATAVLFFAVVGGVIVGIEMFFYDRSPAGQAAKARRQVENEHALIAYRARHQTWVEERPYPVPAPPFPERPFWVARCSGCDFYQRYLEDRPAADRAARLHHDHP